MGKEAVCTVRFRNQAGEGKALLETDEIIFRGDFRLKILLTTIESLSADDGVLTIVYPEGTASFELGPQAEKWAHAIRTPRTLLDKLGVKAGQRVAVVNVNDKSFLRQLRERVGDIALDEPQPESDLIFVRVEFPADLDRFENLRPLLRPAGAIWAIWPRSVTQIKGIDVLEAGRAAGLVDTKNASFSETHSSNKFVIPVDQRQAR